MKRTSTIRHAAGALGLAIAALSGAAPAAPRPADDLGATYERLREPLARSPFGRPLVLESGGDAAAPRGEVHAIVEHPFAKVAAALGRVANWCDMLILQHNVKRCVPAQTPAGPVLQVAIGRKSDQPVEEAFPVDFRYTQPTAGAGVFAVRLDADAGPLGTRDYRIALEAMPIDAGRTFVRMSYAYASGLAARLATEAYLATTGRDKVGFSVAGHDADGRPLHVRGVQGIAERNTMRYFLAIDTYLDVLDVAPQDRVEQRLQRWFAATERYPRQLREMGLADYLAMKRREVALQLAARRGADAAARPPG